MAVDSSGGLELKGNLSSAPPCTDSELHRAPGEHLGTRVPERLVRDRPVQREDVAAAVARAATPDAGRCHPVRPDRHHDVRRCSASQVTYDVAYDVWLNASDTKTPCRTDGTLEVMVWTDYDARALLPDSLKVGTATVPFAVNGDVDPGNQAWSVYVNNVFRNGHTVPWGGTVWLVLDAAHAVEQGTVTVDLSSALSAVGALLQNNYGWGNFASSYWLDTIAFGMEFGPQNADPYGAGPTDFSLNLTSYCLEVRTTVAAAAC